MGSLLAGGGCGGCGGGSGGGGGGGGGSGGLLRQVSTAEGELRDLDGGDVPGGAAVGGGHLAGDAGPPAEGGGVGRVGRVEDDAGAGPRVGADGAAVVGGALDRAAPALRPPAAGRERGRDGPVDRHRLRVVPRGVVELVCRGRFFPRAKLCVSECCFLYYFFCPK